MKLEEHPRTKHDEWAKEVLGLLLEQVGKVELDARIAGTVRRGDVLFTEEKPKGRQRKSLGLLGELARGLVLFEPFRNPVTPWELETCVAKVIEHTAQLMRAARREKRKLSKVKHTTLCIITPSMSGDLKEFAELTLLFPNKPGWYRLANLWHAVCVVVDELPRDESTLWLRLLGRDEVQQQAVEEFCMKYASDPIGDAILQLLARWRQSLPMTMLTNLTPEVSMYWRQLAEKWDQKTMAKGIAQGVAQGVAQGRAESILRILNERGLSVTATQRKQILACKDVVQLDQWLGDALRVSDVKALLASGSPKRPRTQRRAA